MNKGAGDAPALDLPLEEPESRNAPLTKNVRPARC